MEIKCLSLGDPNKGFTNYFAHGPCFDSLAINLELEHTSELTQALRLNEWQLYSGTQFERRECCICKEALDNAIQE